MCVVRVQVWRVAVPHPTTRMPPAWVTARRASTLWSVCCWALGGSGRAVCTERVLHVRGPWRRDSLKPMHGRPLLPKGLQQMQRPGWGGLPGACRSALCLSFPTWFSPSSSREDWAGRWTGKGRTEYPAMGLGTRTLCLTGTPTDHCVTRGKSLDLSELLNGESED